jgi:hypothetical protein
LQHAFFAVDLLQVLAAVLLQHAFLEAEAVLLQVFAAVLLQQAFLEAVLLHDFFAQAVFVHFALFLQHFLSATTTPAESITVRANKINFFIFKFFMI